jgi:ATP-binding cassette subfamily B protein
MNADRIIALDNGRVAGIGTHRELMDTCEVYREIVVSQLATEAIA